MIFIVKGWTHFKFLWTTLTFKLWLIFFILDAIKLQQSASFVTSALPFVSTATSFLALSFASIHLFFAHRTDMQSDVDSPSRTKMIVTPFIVILNAATTIFWCVLARLFEAYTILLLLSNWLATLLCTMIVYKIRSHAPKNRDKTGNKHEDTKIILATVFTAWISPVTVWSNTHKNHSLLLLATGITNTISMYAMVATMNSLKPEILLFYLEFYNWENHFKNAYAYVTMIAAIVLGCSAILQFLGNPHNIYKVSKSIYFKPIISRQMIYDFLENPDSFPPGSICFQTNIANILKIF